MIATKMEYVRSNKIQPLHSEVVVLPFDPKRIYNRILPDNNSFSRNWVTVKVEDRHVKGIYCNVCLAFASSDSAFTEGFDKYSHVYERVSDHEGSKSHNAAVAAYLSSCKDNDISSCINRDMVNLRKLQVLQNIEIFKRIVSIIKFIGKQCIAYRGHRFEAGYSLDDKTAIIYGQ